MDTSDKIPLLGWSVYRFLQSLARAISWVALITHKAVVTPMTKDELTEQLRQAASKLILKISLMLAAAVAALSIMVAIDRNAASVGVTQFETGCKSKTPYDILDPLGISKHTR